MARQKKSAYPAKRTMNLFYRPDRTTKPATAALYVLFALTVLLGLSKVLVYDLWTEARQAQRNLEAVELQRDEALAELADYSDVLERYRRYAATEEERALVDRMEVLELLDGAVGGKAQLDSVAIAGDTVQVQFSGVTLAQTAQIVSALEDSPIVAGTVVNTASTTEDAGAVLRANVRIQLRKGDGQ